MKIHIIGGSGSGKTFLASRLSRKFGIPHYDLDELQWDNRSEAYGIKRGNAERQRMLQTILSKDSWIIEGVYYKWCGDCFEQADVIYLLEVPRRTYRYRIIKRFVKRKVGIEKGKKESLQSLRELLDWADKYQDDGMAEINRLLEPYEDKVIRLR